MWFIGLKYNLSLFVLFVSILFILGWVLSILMFLSPISLATFTKKLLNMGPFNKFDCSSERFFLA
jgi:hypothetical protein